MLGDMCSHVTPGTSTRRLRSPFVSPCVYSVVQDNATEDELPRPKVMPHHLCDRFPAHFVNDFAPNLPQSFPCLYR